MDSLFINKEKFGEYIMGFIIYALLKFPKFRRIFVASSMTSDNNQLLPNYTASRRRWPQASQTSSSKQQGFVSIKTYVEWNYTQNLPIILNHNLQSESYKIYDPLIPVTWLAVTT
jgi:hypothetical protein